MIDQTRRRPGVGDPGADESSVVAAGGAPEHTPGGYDSATLARIADAVRTVRVALVRGDIDLDAVADAIGFSVMAITNSGTTHYLDARGLPACGRVGGYFWRTVIIDAVWPTCATCRRIGGVL